MIAMKMRLATEFSRRRKLQLLTKQRPPEVQNDLLFGITTKSICLARKRSWRLVWLSLKRSLRPKSIRVTWEYKFGLDAWMLCFLVSLQHLSSSVFSLGRGSYAAFSEFQAAEAEKAAEVQKALEAQTAAEAQLAAAGGHAGQCPWRLDRFWILRCPRPWGSSFQSNTGSTCDCLGLISTRVSDPKSWRLGSDLSKLLLIKSPAFSNWPLGAPLRCLKSQSCAVVPRGYCARRAWGSGIPGAGYCRSVPDIYWCYRLF